jgi:large repetitive protein
MSGSSRTGIFSNISKAVFLEGAAVNSLKAVACVERLESRTMLSGHPIAHGGVIPSNVTAKVVNGDDVQIRGDALANSIIINQSGVTGADIRITGLAGTTINGQSGVVTLRGIEDINIQMGDGNDSVLINNTQLAGSMVIDLGNGSDSSALNDSSIGTNLRISDAAGGSNSTILNTAINGIFKFRGGIGADTLAVDNVTVRGKTDFRMRAGDDPISIDDSVFFGTVKIATGPGQDHLVIERANSATGKTTTFRQAVDFRFADDNDLLDIGVTGETGHRAIFQKTAHWDGGRGNSDFETRSNASFISGQPTIRRWEID